MSRSTWKPSFVHPQTISKLNTSIISVQNRATCITSSIIKRSFNVYNGCRWFTIIVRPEIVGYRVGEFAPTRKRPSIKKKKRQIKKLYK